MADRPVAVRPGARCLIAADVDKTLLAQEEGEHKEFLVGVVNHLVRTAELGAHLAFLTGNDMEQMARRFISLVVKRLCEIDKVPLLERMHFFCNSSGMHAHFPVSVHPRLRQLAEGAEGSGSNGGKRRSLAPPSEVTARDRVKRIMSSILHGHYIRHEFLNKDYLERTLIPPADLERIASILDEEGNAYWQSAMAERSQLENLYDLNHMVEKGQLKKPQVDRRLVPHPELSSEGISVQVTLKPVLSFRQAKSTVDLRSFVGNDIRTKVIAQIQERLDRCGLGHYVARAGGRASIDVTLENLDKSMGLRWLISHLGVEGSVRQSQHYGSNTMYFGDEVIVGGGNDYAITKIPGVLVFAVNEDTGLVPFHSGVIVPFEEKNIHGPYATERILARFVEHCQDRLASNHDEVRESNRPETAVQSFRREFFRQRVIFELQDEKPTSKQPAPWEWESLYVFVRLVRRADPLSQRWTEILRTQLDAISASSERPPPLDRDQLCGARASVEPSAKEPLELAPVLKASPPRRTLPPDVPRHPKGKLPAKRGRSLRPTA